jgi:hypothetical protein
MLLFFTKTYTKSNKKCRETISRVRETILRVKILEKLILWSVLTFGQNQIKSNQKEFPNIMFAI